MEEKTLASTVLYEGQIIKVRRDRVLLPNGQESHREIVDHEPAVVILPVDAEGRFHLIRQFRKPLENVLIEAPAGLINPGEDPLVAAKRELLEETGLTALSWTPLYEGYPTPGFCNELYHLYLAEDLSEGTTSFDDDEYVEPHVLTSEQLEEHLNQGQLKDVKTTLAYLLYQRHRLSQR